jgi:cysteinyl-tRNA synthetase
MQLSGEKMSKSIGNLITIDDFLANHEAEVLRMMILNTSYRRPLTYSEEVVESATGGLERLRSGLRAALPAASGATKEEANALNTQTDTTRTKFIEAMDDDINSAGALSQLFELVRAINQARDAGASSEQLQPAQKVLRELGEVLGLRLQRSAKEVDAAPFAALLKEVAAELDGQKVMDPVDLLASAEKNPQAAAIIDTLLTLRVNFRAQKQWKLSDMVRDRLAALGVVVEDSTGGSSWRWE